MKKIYLDYRFYLILIPITFIGFNHAALVTHTIPILIEKNYSNSFGVFIMSLLGPSQVAGRGPYQYCSKKKSKTSILDFFGEFIFSGLFDYVTIFRNRYFFSNIVYMPSRGHIGYRLHYISSHSKRNIWNNKFWKDGPLHEQHKNKHLCDGTFSCIYFMGIFWIQHYNRIDDVFNNYRITWNL